MPEQAVVVEPKTDGFELKAKLLGSFDEVAKRLGSLQPFSVSKSQDGLKVLRIESHDIQKRPFLFMILDMRPDRLIVYYTIALDASPKIRKLSVLRTVLSLLSMVSDVYSVEDTAIFQYLDSAIDDVLSSLSQNYSSLFNNYDSLFNEYKETKSLNIELETSNKNLTVQALQLDDENKQLRTELSALETYSDNSLMVMVQDWLESHDDAIDINDFAKNYKIPTTRVEQILDRMVSLGYIDLKG